MLEEMIGGQNDSEYLASLALGHLRAKTPQLRLALEGKIRPHHRFLLRRLLDQLRFVEHEIALLDKRLEDIGRQQPELLQAARWDTIPGIDRLAGWVDFTKSSKSPLYEVRVPLAVTGAHSLLSASGTPGQHTLIVGRDG